MGSSVLYIEVDVIEYDIPLLVSIEIIKKRKVTINFKDYFVEIFGASSSL